MVFDCFSIVEVYGLWGGALEYESDNKCIYYWRTKVGAFGVKFCQKIWCGHKKNGVFLVWTQKKRGSFSVQRFANLMLKYMQNMRKFAICKFDTKVEKRGSLGVYKIA